MQRYKCHKEVEAARVESVREFSVIAGGKEYALPPDMLKRCREGDGGYVVRYADGYLSWSPSKPFEDGYSLIGE